MFCLVKCVLNILDTFQQQDTLYQAKLIGTMNLNQILVFCWDAWYDELDDLFVCSLPHCVDQDQHFLKDILPLTNTKVIQN